MTEQTTLYVTKGLESIVSIPKNLKETNSLSTGHVFNSVAKHFNKDKSEYPRWISFSKNRNEFNAIDACISQCSNDMEKFDIVCDWLGEDPIT